MARRIQELWTKVQRARAARAKSEATMVAAEEDCERARFEFEKASSAERAAWDEWRAANDSEIAAYQANEEGS